MFDLLWFDFLGKMSRYLEKMGIGDSIEGGNEFNNFALTNVLRHFSAGLLLNIIIEYIF